MRTFSGITELAAAVGTHLGYGDWQEITQEQINSFAEATGDHQWIHVDEEKAAKGPFGTTIAHGFLTVSLLPQFAWQIYRVEGLAMAINYGSDKVRFPAVVPVGSRLRAGIELLEVTSGASGTICRTRITIDRDGSDKPACVAESVSFMVPANSQIRTLA